MSSDYTLAYGTHATPDDGRCAMEWVSHLAGEPHSDEPACVSPVLRALCIGLNDGLQYASRQRLRPYLARTIGTADDGLDPARGWMAMDWLTRVYAPAWLRVAGLDEPADGLASLPPVRPKASLRRALEALDNARRQARGARPQAFGTSRAAAWTKAAVAARAGREAAWVGAGAAVWAAARVAIEDIGADRVGAAARSVAGDAAAAAAGQRRATRGGSQNREGAWAVLAPTTETLTRSAVGLLDRMLPTVAMAIPEQTSAQLVAVP
jgi:hypothetical protein